MTRHSRISILLFSACIFGVLLFGPARTTAEETSSYNLPKRVHIDLNKDFYDSLKNNDHTGAKVHTTDPSELYLQLILKNQEEIKHMLHLILEKRQ